MCRPPSDTSTARPGAVQHLAARSLSCGALRRNSCLSGACAHKNQQYAAPGRAPRSAGAVSIAGRRPNRRRGTETALWTDPLPADFRPCVAQGLHQLADDLVQLVWIGAARHNGHAKADIPHLGIGTDIDLQNCACTKANGSCTVPSGRSTASPRACTFLPPSRCTFASSNIDRMMRGTPSRTRCRSCIRARR